MAMVNDASVKEGIKTLGGWQKWESLPGRRRRFARRANTPPFVLKPRRMGHPIFA